MLGASDGAVVGLRLGELDGARVGDREGCSELYAAALLGASVGDNDGNTDGAKLGVPVAESLGARDDSTCVGWKAGRAVRAAEGAAEGCSVGENTLNGGADGENVGVSCTSAPCTEVCALAQFEAERRR